MLRRLPIRRIELRSVGKAPGSGALAVSTTPQTAAKGGEVEGSVQSRAYVALFTATTNGFSLSARLWVTNALAPRVPSFRARWGTSAGIRAISPALSTFVPCPSISTVTLPSMTKRISCAAGCMCQGAATPGAISSTLTTVSCTFWSCACKSLRRIWVSFGPPCGAWANTMPVVAGAATAAAARRRKRRRTNVMASSVGALRRGLHAGHFWPRKGPRGPTPGTFFYSSGRRRDSLQDFVRGHASAHARYFRATCQTRHSADIQQLRRISLRERGIAGVPANIDAEILAFDPSELSQRLRECPYIRLRHRIARRTAVQRDDLAAAHPVTSSARASSVGGALRPSARAVLRLITSSNLAGCMTGRSAGLSPLCLRRKCCSALVSGEALRRSLTPSRRLRGEGKTPRVRSVESPLTRLLHR